MFSRPDLTANDNRGKNENEKVVPEPSVMNYSWLIGYLVFCIILFVMPAHGLGIPLH
jgi:hypothetical protein